MKEANCEHCDEVGGQKTVENQVCMPINGRVRCIDWCIHPTVAALNAAGIRTTNSCCGHGTSNGDIMLEDGRVLIIHPETPTSLEEWRKIVVWDRPGGTDER